MAIYIVDHRPTLPVHTSLDGLASLAAARGQEVHYAIPSCGSRSASGNVKLWPVLAVDDANCITAQPRHLSELHYRLRLDVPALVNRALQGTLPLDEFANIAFPTPPLPGFAWRNIPYTLFGRLPATPRRILREFARTHRWHLRCLRNALAHARTPKAPPTQKASAASRTEACIRDYGLFLRLGKWQQADPIFLLVPDSAHVSAFLLHCGPHMACLVRNKFAVLCPDVAASQEFWSGDIANAVAHIA